jgi:hypothetical protein
LHTKHLKFCPSFWWLHSKNSHLNFTQIFGMKNPCDRCTKTWKITPKKSNVIKTRTSVIFTYTSVIKTSIVWWSKCDFNTHECDLYTQIRIFTRRVRFLHADCAFCMQCVISTRNLFLERTNVTTTHTTVILTRTRVFYIRRVWFSHTRV